MNALSRIALCGVLFFAIAACGRGDTPFEIVFEARQDARTLQCSDEAGPLRLTDLRFFVHNVRLVDTNGTVVNLEFLSDGRWQNDSVALIDLEDGSGDCLNGSATMNAVLSGRAPPGDYRELRFTLGVPEAVNHGDPLTANPPLTNSAMHWHWRSGYKFLRAGVRQGSDGYRLHLGSTRCHGVIGNLQGCDASNRPEVVLAEFRSESDKVTVDIGALFTQVDLADGVAQSCEMGPAEVACNAILAPLGLATNGDSIAPAAIFSSAPKP